MRPAYPAEAAEDFELLLDHDKHGLSEDGCPGCRDTIGATVLKRTKNQGRPGP